MYVLPWQIKCHIYSTVFYWLGVDHNISILNKQPWSVGKLNMVAKHLSTLPWLWFEHSTMYSKLLPQPGIEHGWESKLTSSSFSQRFSFWVQTETLCGKVIQVKIILQLSHFISYLFLSSILDNLVLLFLLMIGLRSTFLWCPYLLVLWTFLTILKLD